MKDQLDSYSGGVRGADSAPTPSTAVLRDSSGNVQNIGETVQNLTVTGAVNEAGITVSANYTVQPTDYIIECDATTAAFAVTLPPSSANANRKLIIQKKDSAAHNVTITPNGTDTIDGAASKVLSTQWQVATLWTDGTGPWEIIGN